MRKKNPTRRMIRSSESGVLMTAVPCRKADHFFTNSIPLRLGSRSPSLFFIGRRGLRTRKCSELQIIRYSSLSSDSICGSGCLCGLSALVWFIYHAFVLEIQLILSAGRERNKSKKSDRILYRISHLPTQISTQQVGEGFQMTL